MPINPKGNGISTSEFSLPELSATASKADNSQYNTQLYLDLQTQLYYSFMYIVVSPDLFISRGVRKDRIILLYMSIKQIRNIILLLLETRSHIAVCPQLGITSRETSVRGMIPNLSQPGSMLMTNQSRDKVDMNSNRSDKVRAKTSKTCAAC